MKLVRETVLAMVETLKKQDSMLFKRYMVWIEKKGQCYPESIKLGTIEEFLERAGGLKSDADDLIREELWRVIDSTIANHSQDDQRDFAEVMQERNELWDEMEKRQLWETDLTDAWNVLPFPDAIKITFP